MSKLISREMQQINYDGLSHKTPRLTYFMQTEVLGAWSNNQLALSYLDSTWQESEVEKYLEQKRQRKSAIYCYISRYGKQCSMFFGVSFFSFFQKRLDRKWENTPKSPLPLLPSGTNIAPDKPQQPGSAPKFSLQWS